ncbi:hypothetical protein BT96DRAFT_1023533 [Gymnopus androsaceus JB14]|uniref:Uncharacterized protein n=1 Tax=Gymnopus androsaceus JB14 TaxID=1447944 RepID=A0A6A4H338_9AGAR|nr:hypothetical protein BT96DRAFT_1023533 [Gymnopus androsaceus JB14]
MKIINPSKNRDNMSTRALSSPSVQKPTSPPPLTLITSPQPGPGRSGLKPTETTTPSSSGPSTSSSTSFNLDSTTSTQTNLTSLMSSIPSSKPQQNVSPEIQSLANFIGNLRQTIEAIKGTCGFLAKSTEYVAKAGPAIKGAEELEKVRDLLQSRKAEHEAELAKLEAELSTRLQDAIKSSLRDEAVRLVKERVREELSNSVNKQLHLQLPVEVYDQTKEHPAQILQARTSVYNSEARARNSAVRASSDPLRPLQLRNGQVHPLFPLTVRNLADLSNDSVRALLEAYEVIPPLLQTEAQPVQSAGGGKNLRDGSLTREEKINSFMTFIGIPLRVIPTPSSASSSKEGKRFTSTLLISSCY